MATRLKPDRSRWIFQALLQHAAAVDDLEIIGSVDNSPFLIYFDPSAVADLHAFRRIQLLTLRDLPPLIAMSFSLCLKKRLSKVRHAVIAKKDAGMKEETHKASEDPWPICFFGKGGKTASRGRPPAVSSANRI